MKFWSDRKHRGWSIIFWKHNPNSSIHSIRFDHSSWSNWWDIFRKFGFFFVFVTYIFSLIIFFPSIKQICFFFSSLFSFLKIELWFCCFSWIITQIITIKEHLFLLLRINWVKRTAKRNWHEKYMNYFFLFGIQIIFSLFVRCFRMKANQE